MTVRDDLAAMDNAAEIFVWKTTSGLRKAGNGDNGKLRSALEPAPTPHQAGTNLLSANDDQRVREFRGNENLVAAIPTRHKIDPEEPARVLRQRRPGADVHAGERVDEAVSHLIRALSNETGLKRYRDRIDDALADLLFALSKQASCDWERLRVERTAAKQLRLAQYMMKAERELTAIRQFRKSRRWRTASYAGDWVMKSIRRHGESAFR